MAKQLPIADLDKRHSGVTPARAASYFEAACVCLTRYHASPVEFSILDNTKPYKFDAVWIAATAAQNAAWAEETEATDHGASCCVLAAVEAARGHLAVRRAEKGYGADYYVGPPGSGIDDLEDCYRLEISGVSRGGEDEVKWRLNAKVKQAKDAKKNSLPALAGVVGFEAKHLMIRDVTA